VRNFNLNTYAPKSMATSSFYDDQKFCHECDTYVAYLMSAEASYCTNCGSKVRLLSKQDWGMLASTLKPAKQKGGRPRKKRSTA